jgi:hypothetical protein
MDLQEQADEQERQRILEEQDQLHKRIEDDLLSQAQHLETRIQMAESDTQTTIQSLMDAQALSLTEMHNYYQHKVHLHLFNRLDIHGFLPLSWHNLHPALKD